LEGDANSYVSYTLLDSNPMAGTNYYRLKQTHTGQGSGSSAPTGVDRFSKITSVEFDKRSGMSVFPNPSSEFFEIKMDVPTEIRGWKLINMEGRIVKDNGGGSRVDLNDLSFGEYILEVVTANGDKYTKKVIKL
jgi:hypothetical protein